MNCSRKQKVASSSFLRRGLLSTEQNCTVANFEMVTGFQIVRLALPSREPGYNLSIFLYASNLLTFRPTCVLYLPTRRVVLEKVEKGVWGMMFKDQSFR